MGRNLLASVWLNSPGMSGTLTIADASDEYVEAIAYAYDNRLQVPVPHGMGIPLMPLTNPMYVRHFEARSHAIDVTVIGGPPTYITGEQTVTIEFDGRP